MAPLCQGAVLRFRRGGLNVTGMHVEKTRSGRLPEVFRAFGVLGLTSFGGPTAHLGYFRTEFVSRRKWLTDGEYADIVALCQFLPGPASSQVGMALGWRRAGLPGLAAAFVAFTFPSALLLALAAVGVGMLGDITGPVAGLKAAAVAVVAVALWGMASNLVRTRLSAVLAVGALAVVLLAPAGWGAWSQVAAIVAAAVVGAVAGRRGKGRGADDEGNDAHDEGADAAGETDDTGDAAADGVPRADTPYRVPAWVQIAAALAFAALLAAAFAPVWWGTYVRAGSLVFGGGHVVLPLLQGGLVPGDIGADSFLAGYGLAQAVPGPLFTFASYLGMSTGGALAAVVATLAIFLPSILLLIAVLPGWAAVASNPSARAIVAAINAAVVGLLGAAFYDPVWVHGVTDARTFVVAVAALVALVKFKAPPWAVVLAAGLIGWVAL